MSRVLIRGGCVLTLGRANHPVADVLIDGGRIGEVGQGLRARDAEVIDAEGAIVMPGFVDAHRHAADTLFRNSATPVDRARFGPHLQPDDLYAGTLIALLSALDAGVTSVADWVDASSTEHLAAARQAHLDSGARTVLVAGGDGQSIEALASLDGPRLTRAAGPSTPDGWGQARSAGLRIHAHAGTTPSDAGTIAGLGGDGRLGADVTLIHCTHASDEDLDAIAAAGSAVVSTPSSEMAGGMGSPPLQRFIDRGIRPGLGIDTELTGAPTDVFAQMRAAISVQHATYFDLKLAGKAGLPRLLTTRDVIRWGTVDGARAAGLSGVGTLEPGSAADVIVLRADAPNIHPVNDPIGAVVWGMDTSNVEWVIVDGQIVKRAGQLGGVDRARTLAIDAQRRVASAAGLVPV